MVNLTTAIYGAFIAVTGGAHNDFFNDIGGRLFEDEVPEGTEYPYAVYKLVSDIPEYPGGKRIEKVKIQISLFSASPSASEIKTILADMRALYDDCTFDITANDLIYFIRGNLVTMREEHAMPSNPQSGVVGVRHYAQEYDIWMVSQTYTGGSHIDWQTGVVWDDGYG